MDISESKEKKSIFHLLSHGYSFQDDFFWIYDSCWKRDFSIKTSQEYFSKEMNVTVYSPWYSLQHDAYVNNMQTNKLSSQWTVFLIWMEFEKIIQEIMKKCSFKETVTCTRSLQNLLSLIRPYLHKQSFFWFFRIFHINIR